MKIKLNIIEVSCALELETDYTNDELDFFEVDEDAMEM